MVQRGRVPRSPTRVARGPLSVPLFRDFFLYTHCPSPSGPRSGTGRGTPSIGMRGLNYVYREGRAAISEGRVASPKEGSPRSTRAGASQRSGQASGHRRKSPLVYETGCYRLTIPPGGGCPPVSKHSQTLDFLACRRSEHLLSTLNALELMHTN